MWGEYWIWSDNGRVGEVFGFIDSKSDEASWWREWIEYLELYGYEE
jgi:hypothetical protein